MASATTEDAGEVALLGDRRSCAGSVTCSTCYDPAFPVHAREARSTNKGRRGRRKSQKATSR